MAQFEHGWRCLREIGGVFVASILHSAVMPDIGNEEVSSEAVIESNETAITRARDLVTELATVTQYESALLQVSEKDPPLFKTASAK